MLLLLKNTGGGNEKNMNNFQQLRDYIQTSQVIEIPLGISQDDIILYQTVFGTNYLKILQQVRNCSRAIENFDVIDFDDTLCSRIKTLVEEILLQDNRGKAGNEMIQQYLWGYQKYSEKYYKDVILVKSLLNVLLSKESLLLSAGDELQEYKFSDTRIAQVNVPKTVVTFHNQKPLQILKYILEKKCIPKKIIIYDDKTGIYNTLYSFWDVEYKNYGYLLAKTLEIEVVVNTVVLDKIDGAEIDYMEQYIYKPDTSGNIFSLAKAS